MNTPTNGANKPSTNGSNDLSTNGSSSRSTNGSNDLSTNGSSSRSTNGSSGESELLFGRFKCIRELGEGGMASVLLAEMQGPGGFAKRVALKVIHPDLARDPEFSKMFISEARLGGYLSHPNIVETMDFGESDGRFYLAMEYVDGATLDDILITVDERGERIPLDIAIQLLIQVCEGLAYAHRARDNEDKPLHIIHRDVKPSNILISRHGEVKIGDFGVARAESNLARTKHSGLIKGTLRYMSPEQAWGSKKLDGRSDLFCAGAIFYEMLTNRGLYEGDQQGVLIRIAQDADVGEQLKELPESLPERARVGAFLDRALAREPDDRFQTGGEMTAVLRELLETLPSRNTLAWWLDVVDVFGAREAGDGSSAPATVPSMGEMERPDPAETRIRDESLSTPGSGKREAGTAAANGVSSRPAAATVASAPDFRATPPEPLEKSSGGSDVSGAESYKGPPASSDASGLSLPSGDVPKEPPPEPSKRSGTWKILIPLVILLVGVAVAWTYLSHRIVTLESADLDEQGGTPDRVASLATHDGAGGADSSAGVEGTDTNAGAESTDTSFGVEGADSGAEAVGDGSGAGAEGADAGAANADSSRSDGQGADSDEGGENESTTGDTEYTEAREAETVDAGENESTTGDTEHTEGQGGSFVATRSDGESDGGSQSDRAPTGADDSNASASTVHKETRNIRKNSSSSGTHGRATTSRVRFRSVAKIVVSVDGKPVLGDLEQGILLEPGMHRVHFKARNGRQLEHQLKVEVGKNQLCVADFRRRNVNCHPSR